MDNINEVLKEKFQVAHDLPGVFFDQDAEMDSNDERESVEKHVSSLWDFAISKEDFELKSVQDVLQDLAFYQKQTKILHSKNVSCCRTYILQSWSVTLYC